jgi:hypothetical protein
MIKSFISINEAIRLISFNGVVISICVTMQLLSNEIINIGWQTAYCLIQIKVIDY